MHNSIPSHSKAPSQIWKNPMERNDITQQNKPFLGLNPRSPRNQSKEQPTVSQVKLVHRYGTAKPNCVTKLISTITLQVHSKRKLDVGEIT